MCRLLFIQNKHEFNISEHLSKFALIAKNSKEYQGHGWGCSYLANNNWQHFKNIKPIWEDDLEKFGNSNRLVVHARSAFEDKNIVVENNMPFHDDNFIFIFNGELRGVKIKAEGRIGAEKIFNFINRFHKDGMEKALSKAVEIVESRTKYIRAMNIIIVDKEKVYYSSFFNEDEEYFQMHYKLSDDELIICSEVYPEETGWEIIKNKTVGVF